MPKANGQNLMVITKVFREIHRPNTESMCHCDQNAFMLNIVKMQLFTIVYYILRGAGVGGKKREFSPRVRKHSFYHINLLNRIEKIIDSGKQCYNPISNTSQKNPFSINRGG